VLGEVHVMGNIRDAGDVKRNVEDLIKGKNFKKTNEGI
jgi:rRNA processing protein Krr1/Pno1